MAIDSEWRWEEEEVFVLDVDGLLLIHFWLVPVLTRGKCTVVKIPPVFSPLRTFSRSLTTFWNERLRVRSRRTATFHCVGPCRKAVFACPANDANLLPMYTLPTFRIMLWSPRSFCYLATHKMNIPPSWPTAMVHFSLWFRALTHLT